MCVDVDSDPQNVRRMTTAIKLNQVIKQHSVDSKLVIINLPGPPKDQHGEKGCILASTVMLRPLSGLAARGQFKFPKETRHC